MTKLQCFFHFLAITTSSNAEVKIGKRQKRSAVNHVTRTDTTTESSTTSSYAMDSASTVTHSEQYNLSNMYILIYMLNFICNAYIVSKVQIMSNE